MRLGSWLGAMVVTLFVAFILTLLISAFAQSARASYEWTAEEKHDLVRCLAAEAPWGNETEQAAVAHVLVKRWRLAQSKSPTYTFGRMVRRYCAIFRVKKPTTKQAWILRMRPQVAPELPSFDPRGSRQRYAETYVALQALVLEIEAGKVIDPLPAAMHWGSYQDHRTRAVTGKLGHVKRLPGIVQDIRHPDAHVRLSNYFYAVINARPKLKAKKGMAASL